MILSVALSPSVDVTYEVAELAEGRSRRPLRVSRVAGGKAINMARAAAVVGADVAVVAALGGDTGDFIRRELEAAGIAVTSVPVVATTRTCVSIHSDASGLMTEIYENATPVTADELALLASTLRQVIAERRPRWVSFSGGAPASLPADALAGLVAIAKDAGARVAVDTHGPALGAVVGLNPDLVKVNRAEAEELLEGRANAGAGIGARGAGGGSGDGAGAGAAAGGGAGADGERTGAGGDAGVGADGGSAAAARGLRPLGDTVAALAARTGGTVIVTDGAAGSTGTDGATTLTATARAVDGGYPVGSGDTYLGALLAALDGDADLGEAMRLATGAALANVRAPGAAVFTPDEAARHAAQVSLTTP